MTDLIQGGCLCGQVRYQVKDEFKTFKICHCTRCQKISGSAHVANAFTSPDNIEWISGQDRLKQYDIPDNQIRRNFCTNCGTGLPFVLQGGMFLIVPVGSLDRQPSVPPEQLIYWADRMSWYDHAMTLEPFEASASSK